MFKRRSLSSLSSLLSSSSQLTHARTEVAVEVVVALVETDVSSEAKDVTSRSQNQLLQLRVRHLLPRLLILPKLHQLRDNSNRTDVHREHHVASKAVVAELVEALSKEVVLADKVR
jgi:hypothetical protein